MSLTFPETALAAKTEVPDEILLSQCTDNGLQIVAADTSTEDEESPVNKSSTSIRSTSSKRIGRGKGENRGRGRRRKTSTSLRSNEVQSIIFLEKRFMRFLFLSDISDIF